MDLAVVILAAGEGTRMKSAQPKVLHEICSIPLIRFVIESARTLNPSRMIAIVGHGAQAVRFALEGEDIEFILQEEQLGTGHAVSVTENQLEDFDGTVIVLSGDTPLIRPQTLAALVETHIEAKAAATLLTAEMDDPTGYGRIIRSGVSVEAIVEQKDATQEPSRVADANETMGVNTRVQLGEADKAMRLRINSNHMLAGVTIIDPETTHIAPNIKIGMDTTIYPMTFITGKTMIGSNCVIGPSTTVEDSQVGDAVVIENSIVRESVIGNEVTLGPFSHVRPGTVAKAGAKVGGFVEVKKSEIGPNSKVPHLSYIGDAIIGEDVNIGAGTITCNYDGANKYTTIVEDGAFIGSDTMLVAPVRIGKGSFTGAGSVITKDVPENSLSVERTEQQIVESWANKRRKKKDKT
ncbi:MAG: NTP transferase domain-containing protein [Rubrobacteridae bacterium]|nr:NTP transferase domain-containing protein [Rubrobacteridae bacterium]